MMTLPRVWARMATRDVEARLEAVQRAALDATPGGHHRATLDALNEAAGQIRDALDTLDALLVMRGAAPQLRAIEVSDLLISALSRWKARAPQHTFELALPGHEPSVVGDAQRIERAVDALISWMVANSPGGDVRVALRYAAPPEQVSVTGVTEEAIVSVRAALREGVSPPLERGDFPQDDKTDGTAAISLTLAREVAAMHGGRVWASPGPGERTLTLGLALPSTPLLAPYQPVDSQRRDPLDMPEDGEGPGVMASASLPLSRQRHVALVAHGDARLARYLRANLERSGYRALTAVDLAATLQQIDVEEPDIILIGADLPAEAPHDPVRRALARTSAPIIVLTREADPSSAALALDAGVADVIAMPFSIEETLARVRRALRSSPHAAHNAPSGRITVCGDLVVDEAERRVTLAGAPVTLSKTEYRLLRALARRAGKTIAHEALLEQVWGPAYRQEIEFIWVYIRRLRRKIEPDPAHPRYIVTTPGVGYQLSTPAPARSGA